MERIIKFRGKSKEDNKNYIGNLSIEYDGTTHICYWKSVLIEPENNYWELIHQTIEVYKDSVSEFTGHLDRDGKEIFENDTITNGRATFKIIFDYFQWICERHTGERKTLNELYHVISEKYYLLV